MRSIRRSLVLLATAGLAAPAAAQGILDHLKCHNVRDPLKLEATADLAAELQPEFSASGCKIGRAKLFCVPATKRNVVPPPADPGLTGQPLADDYVCYRLRCPVQPPDREVSDQFGTRRQAKYKSSLLCVPARKTGATTVTTTTISLPPTTTPVRPQCNGTPTLDPDNVVGTLSASAATTVPVRLTSVAGGVFDLFLHDGLSSFLCPTAGCGPHAVAACGTVDLEFLYTAPASPPPTIELRANLTPHSVPFVCGIGSVGGSSSKSYPAGP